jgi:hypothetical protein
LKFKSDIASIRPLLLNRLIRAAAAAAALQCEFDACRRLPDNDSKSEPLRHIEVAVPRDLA